MPEPDASTGSGRVSEPEAGAEFRRGIVVPPRRPIVAAIAWTVLVAIITLSITTIMPPEPRPADAQSDVFSAERAFRHVQEIGREPHVTGSPGAARVRDYIAGTLTGLGLRPETQTAVGVNVAKFADGSVATVNNIIAEIPGTDPTGRLILMAHYDAVQFSFGANDDGAGVATMLEVARVLTSGPPLRNSVLLLFTDAEEAALAGAEAFISQHPLGRDPAIVYNLEARGSSGPVVMFQTSANNADLIDVYARAAPHPIGTSLAVEVYRLLPNDTDLTPFLAHDRFAGLNAAYIDGSYAYHTPRDHPSTMDRASLQHHGENALGLAREFGAMDLAPLLRPASGDATYFPVFGILIRYPGWLVLPLAIAALLLVGAFTWLARRRGLTSWPRALAGLGFALVPLVAVAIATQVLWAVLVAIRPGYASMLEPGRPGWFRAAAVVLAVSIMLAWYGLSRRRVGPASLAVGGLGLLALLGLVFAIVVPGGAYLLTVPAMFGAVAGIVTLMVHSGSARAYVQVFVLVDAAVVAVVLLAPTVALFMPALGLATGAASMLFAALLGLALLPIVEWLYRPATEPIAVRPRGRLFRAAPALLAFVLAVACAGVGLAVDRWDERYPMPTHLMYTLDADTGTAQWVSRDLSPAPWTGQYVKEADFVQDDFPVIVGDVMVGPAQAAALQGPQVTVVGQSSANGERTLRLRVTAGRPVRFVALFADVGDRSVRQASVEGRDVPVFVERLDRFGLTFHAPPEDGVDVTLTVSGTAPLRLRVVDGSDGLNDLPGFKPRPPSVGIRGSHTSDLVAVARTVTV